MKLSALHLLLTYKCVLECDHCFVWGSPWQEGTIKYKDVLSVLQQAKSMKCIEWIYFEGGEPTLFFPVLLKSVQMAYAAGFKVGIVTNAYWANSLEDAMIWLEPLKGLVDDLSISSDLYHYSEALNLLARYAVAAANELGIPTGVISIASSDSDSAAPSFGALVPGESCLMFRGRAAQKLGSSANHQPWKQFMVCPYEDLAEPERVHIDPLGHVHICQGITIGNVLMQPLSEIVSQYLPESHPIIAPLTQGGPVALVEQYSLSHQDTYADACHLCYSARSALRLQFPEILTPDQAYGVYNSN